MRDGVIVMETMIWPDEVREPAFAFLDNETDLRPQERQMAESLVASMSGDFDPSEYTDDYREALQQVIDAKVEGREIVETEEKQPSAGNVVDLMSALKASVEAAKAGRAAAASTAAAARPPRPGCPPRSPRRRRSTAKKAPAKKSASKAAGEEERGEEGAGEEGREEGTAAKARGEVDQVGEDPRRRRPRRRRRASRREQPPA